MSTINYIRYGVKPAPNFGSEGAGRFSFDATAEAIMAAGYSDKRNPVCPKCWERKSNSGRCAC